MIHLVMDVHKESVPIAVLPVGRHGIHHCLQRDNAERQGFGHSPRFGARTRAARAAGRRERSGTPKREGPLDSRPSDRSGRSVSHQEQWG